MERLKEIEEETSLPADWRTASDPARAAWLFSRDLLESHRHREPLRLDVDVRNGRQQQDNDLVSFYRRPGIQWASPLKCKLKGDDAIGRSVSRHLFSTVMFKLRSGMHFNLEDAVTTPVFEGQTDHLVPSACERLLASDAFATAGRMLGHGFLQGGPGMPGLSPALLHVLLGGSPDSAPLVPEDCPDMDLRDSMALLSRSLDSSDGAEALDSIAPLCVSWGLPAPTATNRKWLHTQLLRHAVLGRTAPQVRGLRRGLEETGVWPLLTQRPDVVPLMFPRESEGQITPHMILDHIVWPSAITVMLEGDAEPESDDDEEQDHQDVGRISGYLRMFIQNASSAELKSLLKFWTGWEVPAERLQLAVVDAAPLPFSLACFEMLRLPRRYAAYDTFARELRACLASVHAAAAGGYAFS